MVSGGPAGRSKPGAGLRVESGEAVAHGSRSRVSWCGAWSVRSGLRCSGALGTGLRSGCVRTLAAGPRLRPARRGDPVVLARARSTAAPRWTPPWSLTIGLMLPCSCWSRRRIASRMRSKPPFARRLLELLVQVEHEGRQRASRASLDACGCSPTIKNGVPPTEREVRVLGVGRHLERPRLVVRVVQALQQVPEHPLEVLLVPNLRPPEPGDERQEALVGFGVRDELPQAAPAGPPRPEVLESSCSTTVARSRLNTERAPRQGYSDQGSPPPAALRAGSTTQPPPPPLTSAP